jgi:hypothetical protein
MSDPIRTALEKAAEAVRVSLIKDGSCLDGEACRTLPCKCASDATTYAVAAFLRSLPVDFEIEYEIVGKHRTEFDALADAVLAAAKDQPNE